MPVRLFAQRGFFLAGLLSLALFSWPLAWAAPQSGEPRLLDTSHDATVESSIREGEDLERTRDWIKAIEHYEHVVKEHPENERLKYGLRRSKAQFSIDRRYADGSFENRLLRMSRSEALQVFDEVFETVRSNYVEPVSATSFVAHGTESLYLALANERFVHRHLEGVDPARITRMRSILVEQYWNRPISQPGGARYVVSEVCDIATREVGLSDSAVVYEYVFGGCNSLDDYSNFLTPDRHADLHDNIEGNFVGLGIELKSELGKGQLLVNVLPESPAAEGGMRPGDYITNIDGIDCSNMTTDEAAKLLRGPVGSSVRLTLLQRTDKQLHDGRFVRRPVHVKSVPVAKIIDRSEGIGYIQMTGFQKSSPDELREALSDLRRQGMRALIWDLRGNPGGLLTAAVEVLDEFLDQGVIVSTHGRGPGSDTVYSARNIGTDRLPLVLLVDGDSASASEIVAGAVHDYRRGTIVGRNTYGKWSVQTIFPLHGNMGLRLTTAKFYSPRGKTYGKIGIEPDVVVELPSEERMAFKNPAGEIDLNGDADLRKGLDILRSQITQR